METCTMKSNDHRLRTARAAVLAAQAQQFRTHAFVRTGHRLTAAQAAAAMKSAARPWLDRNRLTA